MIQTVVTPQKADFDMSVSLPGAYVGKEVHVLFYIDEEVKKPTASILPKKNLLIFSEHLVWKKAKKCKHISIKAGTNGKEILD